MRCALLVLLAACRTTHEQPPPMIEVADYLTAPSHDLDVLVLVDNSNSTYHYQLSLGAAMPTFLASLAAIDGGRPSLHVGVATSDLGTSGSNDPAHPAPSIGDVGAGGCGGEGNNGLLTISGAPVSGTYLIDDGATHNYAGALADALALMFRVGSGGCGFEQHLAGVRRAIAQPANVGFLRDTANLLVLIIADEDDCSVRDAGFFGSDASLGPLLSFRCTAFGVTCNEGLDAIGDKTGCHASADSPYIEDVATTIDLLQQLKPSRVATAVIAGPPAPFDVEMIGSPGGGSTLGLLNSCQWQIPSGIAAADPGVRLAQFGQAFGGRGTVTSICNNDLSPQLAEIGRVTKQLFGTVCLDTTRVDPTTCSATDETGAIPFDIVTDPAACPETADHVRLIAHANAAHVTVHCQAI